MKISQAQIEAAKVLHQLKWLYSADGDERDPKALEIIAAAITAAAEVGPKRLPLAQADVDDAEMERNQIIERCAQVAKNYSQVVGALPGSSIDSVCHGIAAEIMALKEKP